MKKTAFLKKLSAVLMSIVMLLSVLGGTFSVSAAADATAPVDVLAGNTTGKLYSVALGESSFVQSSNYEAKVYDNLKACADSGDFVPFAQDINDVNGNENTAEIFDYIKLGENKNDLINSLTTANNTRIIQFKHTSGGENPLKSRLGIAYDLDGLYNLNSISLTIDKSAAFGYVVIRKFSVYAGNTLDATIFNNKIGEGGGADTTLTATLNSSETYRYVLIMIDHANASYAAADSVNMYSYNPTFKQINLYGTKANDVLLNNTTGRVYGVPFELAQGQAYTPDYDTLAYNELVDITNYWYRYGTDINVGGSNADLDDPSLSYLTDGNSDEVVHLRDSSDNPNAETGKRIVEVYRAAIAYDLGDFYNLDALVLKLDSTQTKIVRNFSVYAGNTLDGTIFNNRIAVGGANAIVDDISVNLEATKVRYVVIVFDHVTNSYESIVNTYGYDVHLKEINLYGNRVESILAGNKSAKLYYSNLTPGFNNGDTVPETIDYDNLAASSVVGNIGFNVKVPDVTDCNANGNTTEYVWVESSYGNPNITVADQLALLTTEGNTTPVKIESMNGGTAPNTRRAGILYDLGARYNLDSLVLSQAFIDDRELHSFSVYAGNTVDATIFENCIGKGGDPTATDMYVELDSKTSARYVLIMLDNMSQTGVANQYTYWAYFTSIKLYGEVANLVAGNSGALYKATFEDDPYTQGQDFVKKDYNTLVACAGSADYVAWAQDANDVDSDTNVNEWLTYNTLGLTHDELLGRITTPGNTTKVRIDHTSGGNASLSSRFGILYDLGAEYNLNEIALTQDISESLFIYNFSVYAGNTLDASIFDNEIGNGGGTTKELTATLDDTVSARYVLIMIDHATQSYNFFINIYAYKTTLTSIEVYGTKASEVEEPIEDVYGDIDVNGKVDIVDYILLMKAILGEATVDSAIADLNGDGMITPDDLVIVKKILLGFDIEPPVIEDVGDPNLDEQGIDGTEAF